MVLGPRFVGERIPQILDMRFQIILTYDHVAGYGSVPFSELGDQTAKKKKERKKQSLVKYKSADILCRAA